MIKFIQVKHFLGIPVKFKPNTIFSVLENSSHINSQFTNVGFDSLLFPKCDRTEIFVKSNLIHMLQRFSDNWGY